MVEAKPPETVVEPEGSGKSEIGTVTVPQRLNVLLPMGFTGVVKNSNHGVLGLGPAMHTQSGR